MKRLFWLGCISYLLIGLAHVVIGAVLPEIVSHYEISYGVGGQLVFTQFAGFLFGVLAVPWLSSKLGKRGTIVFLLGCLAVSEIAYGFLPIWNWMYVIGFAAGFGFGAVEAVVGALIIESMGDKRAVAMGRIEVMFGVGALLMPLICSWLIIMGLWQLSFIFIGISAFALAIGWAILPLGKFDLLIAKSANGVRRVTPSKYSKPEIKILIVFIAFFLLYVGVEMSIVNFVPVIMADRLSLSPAVASLSITFFWITMAIGRFFAGAIAEKIKYAYYVLWSTLGSLIIFATIGFTTKIWSSFMVIMIVGLLMSGIFAIALIFANRVLQGRTERTTSILIASGGVGGALLPLATGWIIDRFSIDVAIGALIGGFILLFTLSFVAFKLDTGRTKKLEV